jgi:hypothetical protein
MACLRKTNHQTRNLTCPLFQVSKGRNPSQTDSLVRYRELVEHILGAFAPIAFANGDIRSQLIFDRDRDRYLVVDLGWDREQRVYSVLVEVDIVDGKLWIQQDYTEHGIAPELVAAGVPREHIVLGFCPARWREDTGYAAA